MRHVTGTGALVRLILRRDRLRLSIWLATIAGLTYVQVVSLQELYRNPGDLAEAAALVEDNAAFIAMAGPPLALETLGGRVVFEISAFAMVLAALMNLFLVTRHVRGDEESGRAELVRAAVVGRHAPVTAALITALLVDVVLTGLLVLALAGPGLDAGGSATLAVGIAGVGLVFAAVGALSAQLTVSTRAASGIAGAVLAAAFVVRAIGDVGDGTLSWASPLGWGQALRPFAGERWWVAGLLATAAAALTWGAYAVNSHRDLGAGVLQPSAGPARAAPSLLRPVGLAVRLQRGVLLGWLVALFLAGVAYGAIGNDVEDLVGDNETLADVLARTGGDLVDSFLSTTALVLALITTGYAVQAALRLRGEETGTRAEPLLATALSRGAWARSHLQVVVAGTVLVLAAAGLGTGITFAIAVGDAGEVPRLLGASLAYTPAVLVVVGAAVALWGLAPRAATAAWALVAGYFVLGFFGDLLNAPGWVEALSPFTHVPSMPAEPFDAVPLAVLTLTAAALAALGLSALDRRDIAAA